MRRGQSSKTTHQKDAAHYKRWVESVARSAKPNLRPSKPAEKRNTPREHARSRKRPMSPNSLCACYQGRGPPWPPPFGQELTPGLRTELEHFRLASPRTGPGYESGKRKRCAVTQLTTVPTADWRGHPSTSHYVAHQVCHVQVQTRVQAHL